MRRLLVGILLIAAASACARKAARIDVLPHRLKIYGLDRPSRLNARILDKKGQPLEIGTANWQTQDAAVAEVDSGGLVTPKSEGKTTVTAKYDTVTTQIPVEVVDVKSIEIQPAALRLVGPAGSRDSPSSRRQELEGRPNRSRPVVDVGVAGRRDRFR